jgi:hypothetical protein
VEPHLPEGTTTLELLDRDDRFQRRTAITH